MDWVRIGLAFRALRRRLGWTQAELGRRARVSQSAVSRLERGLGRSLTIRTVDRVAEALGARVTVRLLWHGEDLDRLLDAAHAEIVDAIVRLLRAKDWDVAVEVTYSIFGERGSIDVLAFHPHHHALLVVEVKSTVADIQSLLAGIDRKARLAIRIAAERGWLATSVSRLLVIAENRTSRRRLAAHAATIEAALPLRGHTVRAWISNPRDPIGGVLFVPSSQRTTPRRRIRPRRSAVPDT